MQFYPSVHTSFFNINGHPLVSNTVDGVLEKLGGDDILERLKRPNSKWNIDSIYEYVLLTTPLEEIPIGASINERTIQELLHLQTGPELLWGGDARIGYH
ncbi:hypothetical protein QVD99_003711 [Batrachochytrium dendrobatidis]|nr:hypothetical protein QVD99_003711 [Batrachochytrium dendrobatidis]